MEIPPNSDLLSCLHSHLELRITLDHSDCRQRILVLPHICLLLITQNQMCPKQQAIGTSTAPRASPIWVAPSWGWAANDCTGPLSHRCCFSFPWVGSFGCGNG